MDEEDIDLKAPIDEDAEAYADPLQETALVSSNFEWLFKDDEILEAAEEELLKPIKSKRGRPSSSGGTYISNNGHIWTLERDSATAALEEEAEALFKHQACGKGPTRSVTNAVESWMLLFDDEMLRMLHRILNEEIRKRRSRNAAERPIDLPELRSWLGLNYLCGVFRNAQHNGPLEELWTLELGNAIFRATMSLARFVFITDCFGVKLDNTMNEAQRLWQKLLINCRSYYGPSSWLCVDEVIALDNLQLVICCDAKTRYMTNAVLNRQPMTPSKELMQLICDYKTTGRSISLGSRYAALKQCEQLLACNLSSMCELQSSSPDYPLKWSGATLVSDNKRLTQQSEVSLMTCGLGKQVNAFQMHLHTSDTCSKFQELSARFSTGFSVAKSVPGSFLSLLHLMLNMAAYNAWILLRLSPRFDATIEQRDFQRQLGLFLTQQRLRHRLHRRSASTTLVMRLQISEILGLSNQRLLSEASSDAKQTQGIGVIHLNQAMLPEDVTLVSRYGEKHRRCKPCARSKRKTKARTRCQQCQDHRCGNHLISRCYECTGVTTFQLPEGN